jgi:hypothetical protein
MIPSYVRSIPTRARLTNLTTLLLASAFLLLGSPLPAQTVPHATGMAHTEQVDLAYETFGTKGAALPIVAINGGPGLSHAYMSYGLECESIFIVFSSPGPAAKRHA